MNIYNKCSLLNEILFVVSTYLTSNRMFNLGQLLLGATKWMSIFTFFAFCFLNNFFYNQIRFSNITSFTYAYIHQQMNCKNIHKEFFSSTLQEKVLRNFDRKPYSKDFTSSENLHVKIHKKSSTCFSVFLESEQRDKKPLRGFTSSHFHN